MYGGVRARCGVVLLMHVARHDGVQVTKGPLALCREL